MSRHQSRKRGHLISLLQSRSGTVKLRIYQKFQVEDHVTERLRILHPSVKP